MEPPVHEIRSLFLREFTKQLIFNYPIAPVAYLPSQEQLFEHNKATKSEIISPSTTIATIQNKEYLTSAQSERVIFKQEGYDVQAPNKIIAIKEIEGPPPIGQGALASGQKKQPSSQNKQQPGLLDQWLAKPEIESIECRGPGQNLIIKRKGAIMQDQSLLAQEDIQKIIQDLALRARTPLEEGVLKAETPAWSVIGIISEFGGNRFLLQKKKISKSP